MGQNFYGDIWKKFWKTDTGREYDPEKVANEVWEFLRTTGDLAKIEAARAQQKCSPWMQIVSVDPIVVLQIPCQHKRFMTEKTVQYHGTKLAIELSFVPEKDMYFDEPLEWLSPTLKTRPTRVVFDKAGEGVIPLKHGRLKLTRQGEYCHVIRE